MKDYLQYCGARDRTVRVMITEVSTAEGQAPATDFELVCFEIGGRCTGGMCPLGATEPSAMERRLVADAGVQTQRARAP